MTADSTEIVNDTWNRYVWLRDNGHTSFVEKSLRCEYFFEGRQWSQEDLAKLKRVGRPALTINKILSTVMTVLGEQIYNRTEIAFRPRSASATGETADSLTRLFKQISDNNNLPWVRSDVFADGIISSRGFYDVRLDTADSLHGEVRIEQLNPRNVLIDADASEYDPDKWADVITTRWMSPDDIALLYSKEKAALLKARSEPYMPYAYDVLDHDRGQFGEDRSNVKFGHQDYAQRNGSKFIRVLERQWKKLDKVAHFADVRTGDLRQVPQSWSDEDVNTHLAKNPHLGVIEKLIPRIRWTIVADNLVLYDDWSPYKHYTVVPYFPQFRRGSSIGLVENLIGPQELLNKSSSQELHVINTTANSGWVVKQNNLVNMSLAELELRGAETGLAVEVREMDGLEKIQPNQMPSGLDRVSFKAETHIDTISGVTRFMKGQAREDVSARAIEANQQQGSSGLVPMIDNLTRTDTILARNILDIVQEFYTEERIIFITSDEGTGEVEPFTVNEVTPEGEIRNDLTLGEYSVVVTSEPEKQSMAETQFEQLVMLQERLGVNVPPTHLIQASRARNKAELIKALNAEPETPEALAARERENRLAEAEVALKEAEAQRSMADAQLKQAKAQAEMAELQAGPQDPQRAEMMKVDGQIRLAQQKMEAEMQIMRERMMQEMQIMREKMAQEMEIKRREEEVKSLMATPVNDDDEAAGE